VVRAVDVSRAAHPSVEEAHVVTPREEAVRIVEEAHGRVIRSDDWRSYRARAEAIVDELWPFIEQTAKAERSDKLRKTILAWPQLSAPEHRDIRLADAIRLVEEP
jgi:hypothetical protein